MDRVRAPPASDRAPEEAQPAWGRRSVWLVLLALLGVLLAASVLAAPDLVGATRLPASFLLR